MRTPALENDQRLYNGGVTVMTPGDYMQPHLDNSHNFDRSRQRDVALLYYISDYWQENYGGALEVWNDNFRQSETIPYRANRLVVMETTNHSWHSVRPIVGAMPRANIIAYFYAPAATVSKPRLTRFTAGLDIVPKPPCATPNSPSGAPRTRSAFASSSPIGTSTRGRDRASEIWWPQN